MPGIDQELEVAVEIAWSLSLAWSSHIFGLDFQTAIGSHRRPTTASDRPLTDQPAGNTIDPADVHLDARGHVPLNHSSIVGKSPEARPLRRPPGHRQPRSKLIIHQQRRSLRPAIFKNRDTNTLLGSNCLPPAEPTSERALPLPPTGLSLRYDDQPTNTHTMASATTPSSRPGTTPAHRRSTTAVPVRYQWRPQTRTVQVELRSFLHHDHGNQSPGQLRRSSPTTAAAGRLRCRRADSAYQPSHRAPKPTLSTSLGSESESTPRHAKKNPSSPCIPWKSRPQGDFPPPGEILTRNRAIFACVRRRERARDRRNRWRSSERHIGDPRRERSLLERRVISPKPATKSKVVPPRSARRSIR